MSQFWENLWTDERTDVRTDRRTNRQTLFYRTLPAEARGPIKSQFMIFKFPKQFWLWKLKFDSWITNHRKKYVLTITAYIRDRVRSFTRLLGLKLNNLFNKQLGAVKQIFVQKKQLVLCGKNVFLVERMKMQQLPI